MESRCPYCREIYWKIFVQRPFKVIIDGVLETVNFDNVPYCRFCKRDVLEIKHIIMVENYLDKKYNGKAIWRRDE